MTTTTLRGIPEIRAYFRTNATRIVSLSLAAFFSTPASIIVPAPSARPIAVLRESVEGRARDLSLDKIKCKRPHRVVLTLHPVILKLRRCGHRHSRLKEAPLERGWFGVNTDEDVWLTEDGGFCRSAPDGSRLGLRYQSSHASVSRA